MEYFTLRTCLKLHFKNIIFKLKNVFFFCQKYVLTIFRLLKVFFIFYQTIFFSSNDFLNIKNIFKPLKHNLNHTLKNTLLENECENKKPLEHSQWRS
jgi:hypothetical protein